MEIIWISLRYGKAILISNHGSTMVIKAIAIEEGQAEVFESIIVTFLPIIRGLFNRCREIIGLD